MRENADMEVIGVVLIVMAIAIFAFVFFGVAREYREAKEKRLRNVEDKDAEIESIRERAAKVRAEYKSETDPDRRAELLENYRFLEEAIETVKKRQSNDPDFIEIQRPTFGNPSKHSWGAVYILLGIVGTGYFMFSYDVAAPGSDTINIGLLNFRLCGVVASCATAIIGAILQGNR